MRFPPSTAARLLRHGLDVVGANYPRKGGECRPTAVALDGVWMNRGVALEEARSIGFGVTLVSAIVLATLPKPWFDAQYDEQGCWHSEDTNFCAKARAAGFHVYVDHELSHEVRHVGMHEFTYAEMMEVSRGNV
jgi:hypothetical protein